MRNKRLRFAAIKSIPVLMDGGLNENVSSIELQGGELISGYNYQLEEGSQGGYVSVKGYERFDGSSKPSSVAATDEDHADQDTRRSEIEEVPGTGVVLGVHIFEGKVYAFRNKEGGTEAGMYVETTDGWDAIDTGMLTLEPDGDYRFINHNFTGDPDDTSMYWVDGKNTAFAYNGTTVTAITNSGMGVNDTPINLIAFNDRLWLAYEGGSLQGSTPGDPTDWTTSSVEFGIGKEITDLLTSVDNTLIIFCVGAIKVLLGYVEEDFELKSYSESSGAYPFTACRLFGTMIFMDDRGVSTLEATSNYGGFEAGSLSQKVQRTLRSNRSSITCATTVRPLNQYRLFFSNGYALFFSFVNTKLRGITLVKYIKPVKRVVEGLDSTGNPVLFFTSTDGFVYQMDSGTSFDGEAINTLMNTAYYHYKSPRNWKRFKEVVFEISSVSDITLNTRFTYDYLSGYVPKSNILSLEVLGQGARWGEGLWGTMLYSGSEATNRIKFPIRGLGSNMSVSLRTSETYKQQHTIQNFTTDFEVCGRQL